MESSHPIISKWDFSHLINRTPSPIIMGLAAAAIPFLYGIYVFRPYFRASRIEHPDLIQLKLEAKIKRLPSADLDWKTVANELTQNRTMDLELRIKSWLSLISKAKDKDTAVQLAVDAETKSCGMSFCTNEVRKNHFLSFADQLFYFFPEEERTKIILKVIKALVGKTVEIVDLMPAADRDAILSKFAEYLKIQETWGIISFACLDRLGTQIEERGWGASTTKDLYQLLARLAYEAKEDEVTKNEKASTFLTKAFKSEQVTGKILFDLSIAADFCLYGDVEKAKEAADFCFKRFKNSKKKDQLSLTSLTSYAYQSRLLFIYQNIAEISGFEPSENVQKLEQSLGQDPAKNIRRCAGFNDTDTGGVKFEKIKSTVITLAQAHYFSDESQLINAVVDSLQHSQIDYPKEGYDLTEDFSWVIFPELDNKLSSLIEALYQAAYDENNPERVKYLHCLELADGMLQEKFRGRERLYKTILNNEDILKVSFDDTDRDTVDEAIDSASEIANGDSSNVSFEDTDRSTEDKSSDATSEIGNDVSSLIQTLKIVCEKEDPEKSGGQICLAFAQKLLQSRQRNLVGLMTEVSDHWEDITTEVVKGFLEYAKFIIDEIPNPNEQDKSMKSNLLIITKCDLYCWLAEQVAEHDLQQEFSISDILQKAVDSIDKTEKVKQRRKILTCSWKLELPNHSNPAEKYIKSLNKITQEECVKACIETAQELVALSEEVENLQPQQAQILECLIGKAWENIDCIQDEAKKLEYLFAMLEISALFPKMISSHAQKAEKIIESQGNDPKLVTRLARALYEGNPKEATRLLQKSSPSSLDSRTVVVGLGVFPALLYCGAVYQYFFRAKR